MDFSSVVKADRDLVVSKATNKAELNKGLRNYSGSSASSTAVDAENAKLNAANPDKHTVAQNKLVNGSQRLLFLRHPLKIRLLSRKRTSI